MRLVRGIAPPPAARPAQIIMLGSAAASVALSIAYFIGWKAVPHPWGAPDILQLTSAILHVIAAGFGPVSDKLWPVPGFASAIFVGASFAYAVMVGFDRQRSLVERCRAIDLAAFMVAFMPVAPGVAYARGGQPSFATSHYSTLALPILFWSFLSWRLGTSRLLARFTQALLCAIIGIFWMRYAGKAVRTRSNHVVRTAEIVRELKSGASADVIVDRSIEDLFFADVPEARKLVKDGIKDFRNAGFGQYGAVGKAD
jgi:hypothetical protein